MKKLVLTLLIILFLSIPAMAINIHKSVTMETTDSNKTLTIRTLDYNGKSVYLHFVHLVVTDAPGAGTLTVYGVPYGETSNIYLGVIDLTDTTDYSIEIHGVYSQLYFAQTGSEEIEIIYTGVSE